MADTPKKKPFDFEVSYELFNTREERLRERLLIENPGAGQVLLLGIVNALVDASIVLNPRERADASTHHFRLRFAPNTLARRSVGVEGEDWISSRVDNADGSTEIYLSWRSPAVTLEPGEWLSLGLKGVSARPGVGAQVVMELKWPKPTVQKDAAEALVIEPKGPGQGGEYELEAQRPLGTLNRQGRPDSSLRVGFVGDNQVLNVDNEQGTLRLRLSNEAPAGSQETLRFVYQANEPTRTSRLVVSLPVGTAADAPWALGTEQQVKDITFSTLADWSRSAATLSSDKTHVEWTFTPSKEVTLAPRAAWELQLGKLVTQHPDGPAELRVRYENVPGYWDGERVCVIEKAPLVFGRKVDASHDYSGRVGIGIANPTARLYLKGGPLRMVNANAEVQHEGPLFFRSDVDKTGDASSVRFLKKDESTPLMELSANGDLSTKGNANVGAQLTVKGNMSADGSLTVKGDMSADGSLTVKGRAKDKTGWLVPVGTIVAFGGPNIPQGWLKCDGSTQSKSTYADLFAAIGDSYNGASAPPSGQFRLPSFLARVPMGAHVSGPLNYPFGTMGGEFEHTLTVNEMPSHNHSVTDNGHTHSISSRNDTSRDDKYGRFIQNWVSGPNHYPSSTNSAKSNISVNSQGGGGAHNNVQPYTTVNFIIKH